MKEQFIKRVLFSLILLLSPISGSAAESLIPVGQTVGVTLDMKGVTVVDTTDIEDKNGEISSPAEKAGIKIGDVIETIDGKPVSSAEDLEKIITGKDGTELKLQIRRGDKEKECVVTPVLSGAEGVYRLGIWVKDAASGIGTVTYLNPETKEFGALGHGIAETPESQPISAKGGEIMDAKIVSIQKGGKGQPGELVGVFTEEDKKLGTVLANTPAGLKGIAEKEESFKTVMDAVPVASREEVETGDAEILSNVEEGKIEKFQVEIQKINKDTDNPKGMVIKVTDPNLLEKTGGIVQGMSGSPIVQNGKLVGAVTHVFVNDPTRGYGIFIENMLAEAGEEKHP